MAFHTLLTQEGPLSIRLTTNEGMWEGKCHGQLQKLLHIIKGILYDCVDLHVLEYKEEMFLVKCRKETRTLSILLCSWNIHKSKEVSFLASEFRRVNRRVMLVFCRAHLWAPTPVKAITQTSFCSSFLCETHRRARYIRNSNWEKYILTMPPTRGPPCRKAAAVCRLLPLVLSFVSSVYFSSLIN